MNNHIQTESPPNTPATNDLVGVEAAMRAAKMARLAAEWALSKVQFMELYNKNVMHQKTTGKTIREMAMRIRSEMELTDATSLENGEQDSREKKDWRRLHFRDRLPWELVAQLLNDRPYIKPTLLQQFTESQLAIIHQARKTLAAFTISKFIRVLSDQKTVRMVGEAVQTVYRELDWGWGEKVYQEALKIELDMLSNGQLQICSEIPHTIHYRGVSMGDGVNARTDILIRDRSTQKKMLLELKAISGEKSSINKGRQQCIRYLRMMKLPIGMVINFPDKQDSKPYITVVYNAHT
jgi:GxxExxY protein